MSRIPLWIDLRGIPVNKRLPYLFAIEEMNAEKVLLEKGDPHVERKGIHVITVDGKGILHDGDRVVGRLVRISSSKTQETAAEADGIVIVDTQDWQVIPMENLIAARGDKPGTLFAVARTPEQAALFADTLEIGVHGIVLVPAATGDIFAADRMLRDRFRPPAPPRPPAGVGQPKPPATAGPASAGTAGAQAGSDGAAAPTESKRRSKRKKVDASGPVPPAPFLVPARILAVDDGGMGDRVCIDTTSLFRDGEGLLVGSTARSFALVHAETVESEYVNARPFRVNAGAVHSYLFAPEGKTRYLSELTAGMPVLAVHPDGIHRVLSIGRSKIERRPHTLVRWKSADHQVGMAVLQTAETIRLVRPDGTLVAVTDLKVDDEILVHNETSARHFGMAVDSHLEEK